MSSGTVFTFPEQSELTEILGCEPIEARPEDGYWCYQVSDGRGVSIRLSFDAFERSVQTVISEGGREVAVVSQEGATEMASLAAAQGGGITCEFQWQGARSTMRLQVSPRLLLRWSTLRTEP